MRHEEPANHEILNALQTLCTIDLSKSEHETCNPTNRGNNIELI